VSEYSQIGKGVIIGPFTSVLNGSRIGQGCCILSHSNINQDVIMEDFCLVGAGTLIGNGVHIGEGCHLGLGSKIHLNRKLEAWTNHE
jgi:acetyltransferase EpsM